jgi:hypothetical protein
MLNPPRFVYTLFDYCDSDDISFSFPKATIFRLLDDHGEWLSVETLGDDDGETTLCGFLPSSHGVTFSIHELKFMSTSFRFRGTEPAHCSFAKATIVAVIHRYSDGWLEILRLPSWAGRAAQSASAGGYAEIASALRNSPHAFGTGLAPEKFLAPLQPPVPGGGRGVGRGGRGVMRGRGGVGARPPLGPGRGVPISVTPAPPRRPISPPPARASARAPGAGAAAPSTKFVANRTTASARVLSEAEEYRAKVIDEIVNTELEYAESLRLLDSAFREPLAAQKLLSPDEVNTIFGNITDLIRISTDLGKRLRTAASAVFEQQVVGTAMLAAVAGNGLQAPFSEYCANHQSALELVQRLTAERPDFKAFQANAILAPEMRMRPLTAFIILPVQRVCKYPLLLGELRKRTNDAHADLTTVIAAKDAYQALVESVNQRTKDIENSKKMAQLATELAGLDKVNTDMFVRDGVLADITPSRLISPGKSERPNKFYLFSNCIIRARPNRSRIRVKPWKVKEVIGIQSVVIADLDDEGARQNMIELVNMSSSRKLRLIAPNADVKEDWLVAFMVTLERVREQEMQAARAEKADTAAAAAAARAGARASASPRAPLPLPPVRPNTVPTTPGYNNLNDVPAPVASTEYGALPPFKTPTSSDGQLEYGSLNQLLKTDVYGRVPSMPEPSQYAKGKKVYASLAAWRALVTEENEVAEAPVLPAAHSSKTSLPPPPPAGATGKASGGNAKLLASEQPPMVLRVHQGAKTVILAAKALVVPARTGPPVGSTPAAVAAFQKNVAGLAVELTRATYALFNTVTGELRTFGGAETAAGAQFSSTAQRARAALLSLAEIGKVATISTRECDTLYKEAVEMVKAAVKAAQVYANALELGDK